MTSIWPVGTLVAEKGVEDSALGLRVVVGHKPDGRCMTAWVDPPPWVSDTERGRILVGNESLLEPVDRKAAVAEFPQPRSEARPRSSSGRFLRWIGGRLAGAREREEYAGAVA
ncbi:MAG: hypothetical protein D6731_15450 [Planctomycetota bacterium]|nr:MAG: hypothetical protein D6731_15450 [Planctomycetota bacterium]